MQGPVLTLTFKGSKILEYNLKRCLPDCEIELSDMFDAQRNINPIEVRLCQVFLPIFEWNQRNQYLFFHSEFFYGPRQRWHHHSIWKCTFCSWFWGKKTLRHVFSIKARMFNNLSNFYTRLYFMIISSNEAKDLFPCHTFSEKVTMV